MKIWRIASCDDNTMLVPVNRWKLDEVKAFDGRSKLETWRVTEVDNQVGTHRKRFPEIVSFAPGPCCALTERAVEYLYDIIVDDVELLPVSYHGLPLWLMYITTVLNCVNLNDSEVVYHSSGKVSYFKKLVFRQEVIGAHNLFKIKQTPSGFSYASTIFKNSVEAIDKRALIFRLVYDSDI